MPLVRFGKGTGVALCRIGLLVGVLLASSCAKLSEPLPPLRDIPPPIPNLRLLQIGEQVRLLFTLPTGELEWVEAYRQCQEGLEGTQPSHPFSRQKVHQIPSQGGILTLTDSPQLNLTCRYAIRLVNRGGRRSPYSNFVEIDLSPTPDAPTGLTHQVQPERIILSWDPPSRNSDNSHPPRVVGYLVNSRHFVENPEFQDLDFQFGQPRSYSVQTVSRQGNPLILSTPSDRLTIVPEDEFPPRTPHNIRILSLEGEIRLLWDANREPDLEGYVVYRGSDPEELTRISTLIRTNSYTDRTTVTGHVYYYRIAAIDQSGNESPRSESFSAPVQ